MQEYATQARQSQGSRSTPYSVFGYGAYDSDSVASGTLGMTADLPLGLVTGFTVATNYVKTDVVYGGNAKMFGGDARGTFAPNSWVWRTLAWGHRPDGGKGANISGTLIDAPFSYTAPGISSARDRAEAGGGVRLPAWNNGAVTASVTASIAPNQTTTYVSRLGVVQAF